MFRSRIAALVLAAAVPLGLVASAGAASASPRFVLPSPVPRVAYETDNGSTWTLSDRGVASAGPETGYADAGEVVDLGPASQFKGISDLGSKGLADNIWIADGSQATVPGTHPLSSPANFDYGLGQANGTFYMTGKPDAYSGQTLTDAQIRADFAGYEVLAWVGIADAGTSASGWVLEVNGQMAFAPLQITAAKGIVTASANI